MLSFFELNNVSNNFDNFVEYFNKNESKLRQDNFIRNKSSQSVTKINVNKLTKAKSEIDYSLSPQHGKLTASEINPLSASVFVGHVDKPKPKIKNAIKRNQSTMP